MTNMNMSLNPQFYQKIFDRYTESTSFTSEVNFWGDVVTTPNTKYNLVGSELHTYYAFWGELEYNTDQAIKYINFSVLLYNRVKDVIGDLKVSFMGPLNGSGTLDFERSFGEGMNQGDIEFMGVKSVYIDYMNGEKEEIEFDFILPVDVKDVETPKDREKKSRPTEPPEIGKIVLINWFLTPIAGLIYSAVKMLQGYKRAAKTYFIVSGIFSALYLVLGLTALVLKAISG